MQEAVILSLVDAMLVEPWRWILFSTNRQCGRNLLGQIAAAVSGHTCDDCATLQQMQSLIILLD